MRRTALVILIGLTVTAPASAEDAVTPRNLLPVPVLAAAGDRESPRWRRWAAREALAPEMTVVDLPDGPALRMRATSSASYGKWIAEVRRVEGGKTYRFEAFYRATDVETEDVSVAAIVSWCAGAGERPWWPTSTGDCYGAELGAPLQRDYVDAGGTVDGWTRVSRSLRSPAGAKAATVELLLRWTDRGTVLWKGMQLTEAEPQKPRLVRVATTRIAIPEPTTVETNLGLVARMLDKAGAQRPDIVLLSEGLNDRWVGPLEQMAQPIPGPFTESLGEKARQYGMYVATSLHERADGLIYNTAVLIDRRGELVGKYRKVHLALEEEEGGITSGAEYPVFDTDFGRVGLMICWDYWFPEPARILRLKGAEMLLLPIAGDGDPRHWDVVSRARAIDNGVYLVASHTVTESGSRIISPTGQVLAETTDDFGVAVSEIDLAREFRLLGLSVGAEGEAKSVYIKERHPQTYGELTRGRVKR